MSGINQIIPKRATQDIDFAVFINDHGVYEQLKKYLIAEEGFNAYKQNTFVLIYKDGTEVDLLPFGAIEDENRNVTIEGPGYTSVSVEGFKEVYEAGLPEMNLDDEIFKLCTLPGIVLLKLIAWNDRPEARQKDIKDFSDILQHLFPMYQEVIWEKHYDLFETDRELIHIAAHVLGREIAMICKKTELLHAKFLNILNLQLLGTSAMVTIMREYFDNAVEDCINLLSALKRGFEDGK
jgi:predicted nucleotidyltransferase